MSSPTFTASLDAGRQRFEAGAFHDAHEAWESGWRRTRGDERAVLQVLVLWSAALHHHQRGKELGATRLLHRALERLAAVDESFRGMDLEGLSEGLVTSLERARAPWTQDAKPSWPESQLRAVHEQLEHEAACPYCGEPVLVNVAPEEAEDAQYVEDCPVCCRPWQVRVTRDGSSMRVELGRDDAQS